MTDTNKLISAELRRSVEQNLRRDPLAVALDTRIVDAALVASQVKYLGRAESKLPSYFAARCAIPARAFEQSSSEATAARKRYSGALCIDLTCGLGVDSLHLSRGFERVIAIERDPDLAVIARENFRRLGAANIEVVNSSAEEFLASFSGAADLVYADPDRRDSTGRKMVRLEDCSPDILALMPVIQQVAPRLVVKLSPMFDVDEAMRLFGPHVRVEVVSLGGECKEVVVEVASDIPQPTICAVAIGVGEVEQSIVNQVIHTAEDFRPETYRWLVVPDVALQKARLARTYFAERGLWIASANGYAFATEQPVDIMGKVLEIADIEPFDPKTLRRRLKTEGIKSLDIMRRDFPLSSTDIARSLGVREGGSHTIAFTRTPDTTSTSTSTLNRLWQITVR
ncbi:MAG: class I SAM-dependent methyltransferase [Rikenellaceae bacterium]|jgi:hypothetical protein|nr:class I SAM-dependent methyltransferase [Rikenellaceae bacterium]